MTDTLTYARIKLPPTHRCRWLVYVFGIYVVIALLREGFNIYEPELHYKPIPVLWSAHTLYERIALFDDDGALWDVISLYPWYFMGLLGSLGMRTRRGMHWALLVAAILGTMFGALNAGMSIYLGAIAPFRIATTDGSIVIYDSIPWKEKILELTLKYMPFVVLSVMLIKWDGGTDEQRVTIKPGVLLSRDEVAGQQDPSDCENT